MQTILDMALGELSYVERLVKEIRSPQRIDSIILITLFMIVVPIALMNLLIGVAVGDIEAIKNQAEIRLLTNQVCEMTSLPINNQLFYKTHTRTHTIFEDNLYTHIPNFNTKSCYDAQNELQHFRQKIWN